MNNKILNFFLQPRVILLAGTIGTMYFVANLKDARPFTIFVIIVVFLVFILALAINTIKTDSSKKERKD